MNSGTRFELFEGPVGAIDVAIDWPTGSPRGIALVAHPHPLQGGTRDNKVAQTLARALVAVGHAVWRPNFRGVGQSAGVHDHGEGETEDLLALIEAIRVDPALPEAARANLVLAGFSFGSFVQTRVARVLRARGVSLGPLVLVGAAVGRFPAEAVPSDTLVIHGECDDIVPLSAVLDWARPQELPVTVLPGADHFFHRRLTQVKRIVVAHLSLWQHEHGVGTPTAV
jgi:alpha/beta superfamily hydrolase